MGDMGQSWTKFHFYHINTVKPAFPINVIAAMCIFSWFLATNIREASQKTTSEVAIWYIHQEGFLLRMAASLKRGTYKLLHGSFAMLGVGTCLWKLKCNGAMIASIKTCREFKSNVRYLVSYKRKCRGWHSKKSQHPPFSSGTIVENKAPTFDGKKKKKTKAARTHTTLNLCMTKLNSFNNLKYINRPKL